MLQKLWRFGLGVLALALASALPAQGASYYQATPTLAALAAYGTASPLIAHATVNFGSAQIGLYEWKASCPSTPDGLNYVAATGMGSGCWAVQAYANTMNGGNNLSDVQSASTSRANLGLGSLATQNSVSFSGGDLSGTSPSPTVTNLSSVTNGSLANSGLAHAATTVNGQTCTLGSTCTVSASATGVTVGTTTISGGTSGKIEENNGGVLGEYSISGSGSVAMTVSPAFTTPSLGAAIATSLAVNGASLGTNALAVTGTSTQSGNADYQAAAVGFEYPNDGSTGTVLNRLVKLGTTGNTVVETGTGDSTGALGICVAFCGSTGNALIADTGTAPCLFDGSATYKHYAAQSPTQNGECTDVGATEPDNKTVVGQVLANVSGNTYNMFLFPATLNSVTGGSGKATKPCATTAGAVQYEASGPAFGCVSGVTSDGTLLKVALNDLRLIGSSTGYTTVSTANSSASNYIQTFQAATGTVADLDVTGQSQTGGVALTAYAYGTVSSGTTTVDCTKNPIETLTNGGAFTLAAPSSDSVCTIKVTNNGSAGTITFSGFTEGSNTGDALDTTNGHKFNVGITRVGGDSHYLVSAYQ